MEKDKRIDAYILKSADFAKPILNHIRKVVQDACPEVKETIKWSFPNFEYNNSILCSMASFKQHCAFGFWLTAVMKDPDKIFLKGDNKTAMGSLGQLKKLEDLPSDKILSKYIKEAMKLIDEGVKLPKKESVSKTKELEIPDYFMKAVKKNKLSIATFEKFSYSQRKEYVVWVTEAKTEETRMKRLETTVEWLAEGKIRNWKYLKC